MITEARFHDFQPRFLPLTLCMLMLVAVAGAVSPVGAHTFGGRSFSAYVSAPTLGVGPIYLADTGQLSPQGGWEGAGQPSAALPGVLSASVLNAATSGADGQTNSSASLADLVVFPGNPAELQAPFAMAHSVSGVGARATTEVSGLIFGGLPVTVTGLPNQVVQLPGIATLVINEQNIAADGSSSRVNALRLTLVTGDEVIIAGASGTTQGIPTSTLTAFRNTPEKPVTINRGSGGFRLAQIQPAGDVCGEEQCIDFVTGGGFFEPPNAARTPCCADRVNFGFNAGPRSAQNPELKGHLNLVDHYDGTHVTGVNVDIYSYFDDDCRVFEGDAKFNGVPGYRYTAGVCDYGEPGRNDFFRIGVTLAGALVYFADNYDGTPAPFGGELDGGNIQLHKSKCTKPAFSAGSKNRIFSRIKNVIRPRNSSLILESAH